MLRCDECHNHFEDKDINCILGVWVCINCYPAGKEYSVDFYENSKKESYNKKGRKNEKKNNKKLF